MKMNSLFKIIFIYLFFYSQFSIAQCGLFEISLNQKVNESNFIIEGEVIHQQCYKSSRANKIFTLNTIKVNSILKGNLPSQIYIVTAGGKLNNEMEYSAALLSLQVGQIGMFFLNKEGYETVLNINEVYMVYASAQGFYAYNLAEQLLSDVFNQYANTGNAFYTLLAQEYNLSFQKIYAAVVWGNSNIYNRLTVINNFSPTAINAGNGEQLIINGFGFGTSRGNSRVLFKNSDNGGLTEISAFNPQYISWSDSKIVVAVPQKAGSGKIAVEIGGARTQSSNSLQVKYAIINTGSDTAALVFPARHVAKNSNKGYVWNMNVNFDSDSTVRSNFLVSFKKWRCKTYVNWTIGNTTQINSSERDTFSVITFDEHNLLPAGVLGLCYSYYSGCTENDWYIEEQDMLIRKSDKWHFGNDAIPSNKLDFQSVVLHELGHAHQLSHVINVSDLMHYSISTGVQKRTIEAANLEGAQWMINKSLESDICDKKRMQLLDSELCNDELFGYYNSIVYPNPFNDLLNIDLYLTRNDKLKVSLFDVTGKLTLQYENASASKGFFSLVFDVPNHAISAGIYILKIEIGEEKSVKKLIKL